jgi:hypothetical protein
MNRILKSYFFWTYPRGNFHYDVLVTLILAFIFITPHLWDYGDKPVATTSPSQPMQITGDGGHGFVITVQAADVRFAAGDSDATVRKALKKALQPVIGDSVYVTGWTLTRDANGSPASWTVWAHR